MTLDNDTIPSIISTELQESYVEDVLLAKFSETLEGPEKNHKIELKDTEESYKLKSSKLEKGIKEASGSIEAHSLRYKNEPFFSKQSIISSNKGTSYQKEIFSSGDNLLEN